MRLLVGFLLPAMLLAVTVTSWGHSHGTHTESLPWFKNSFLDIREDVAEATDAGKRVVLYFHQDGCPYCAKLLADNFGQRTISDKTRSRFDVISINLWGDKNVVGFDGVETTEKAFAQSLKVMFTPTLLFLDDRGRVRLRVNGYYQPHRFDAALDYASGEGQPGESFRDYFARMSPPAASGVLHQETGFLAHPLRLAADGDQRPLLVLFEQRQCLECDELHGDVLQRPETRTLMDHFRIAVVDMWSKEQLQTPDGRELAAREWARELDVAYAPSMVFFAADGAEMFRSEAYLRAFHVQSVLDYVASEAWHEYPELQRYIQARADELREQGVEVDLWQ